MTVHDKLKIHVYTNIYIDENGLELLIMCYCIVFLQQKSRILHLNMSHHSNTGMHDIRYVSVVLCAWCF